MRNNSLFWAIVLILAGVLFLLNNFGILSFNVWSLLWPLFIIALGVSFLVGYSRRGSRAAAEPGSVALDGASRAIVKLHHGAGELNVSAGSPANLLLDGTFGGGFDAKTQQSNGVLEAKVRVPSGIIVSPFNWAPGGLDWNVRLNAGVPIELECETGASKSLLDLRDLNVTALSLETGASKTDVTLPAKAGFTRVKVEAGAASVDIRVPGGVAARIRTESGLASINVDPTRFPGGGNRFESPDYATSTNKVDIDIETGVGSITIS